jgi:amino acid transporter
VKNKQGVPFRILILQALLVSVFCFILELVPSVNTYYWFLMALSTALYMLMYILLFLSALKLKRPENGYQIPRSMRTVSCIAGLSACAVTIVIGFLPPTNIVFGNKTNYVLMIIGGFCMMILPAILFVMYQKKAGAYRDYSGNLDNLRP